MKWDVGDEGRFIDSSEESISDLDFLSVISDFEKHQDEEAFLKDSLDPFYQTPHPPPHWSYSPYSQGTLDYWDNSGEGIDHRLSYHGMYHGSFDGYNEKETYSDSPSSSPETIVKSKKRRKNKSPVEDALKIIKKESQHNLELPKKLFYKHNNSDNPFPKKRGPRPKVLTKEEKKKKRVDANDRERQRMNQLNTAFNNLRDVLPRHGNDRELSKFETIQIAKNYIQTLHQLVT